MSEYILNEGQDSIITTAQAENERLHSSVRTAQSQRDTIESQWLKACAELKRHRTALEKSVATLELCRECLNHESTFLEDYLKTVTHPGVSRLVGDNHDADTMAALTISDIKEVLG